MNIKNNCKRLQQQQQEDFSPFQLKGCFLQQKELILLVQISWLFKGKSLFITQSSTEEVREGFCLLSKPPINKIAVNQPGLPITPKSLD